MKKLLYMGLSALMMLLALMGVGKAQEVTFSPVAGTVPDGSEITITKTGNGTIYYSLYSSLSEAQNDPAFNGNGDDDAFYAAYGSTLIDYGNTHPVITTGKTVIRVGLHDDGWVKTDIYAEYTIASSGPSVTFSPDPNAGSIASGTEITINYSGNATVYYRLYSSMTDAQNDQAFNGTGEYEVDNDFTNAFDNNTLVSYTSTHPVITTGKTVIRVGIHDDGWVKTDIYAEYTITGGETPGPDDPTPTTPINAITFNPASGGEIISGNTITLSYGAYGKVYYKVYATKADAEADNASWDAPTNTNLTEYKAANKPVINENQLVVKANTWLEDGSKWDVFSYAEYTIKTITPAPDFTLAFSPDNTANVESGDRITITATPELTSDYALWFQLYQTESAVETWNDGVNAPLVAGLNAYYADEKPQISTSNGTVLKAGIFDKRTNKWVASSITVKKYTIGEARVPFVISFDPEAGEVDANTTVTLSTTPALSTGFDLYYQLYATESAATSDSWPVSIDPMWLSAALYSSTAQPIITKAKPVLRAAIWNASSQQWESNTVVVYTTPVEAPSFSKASGNVQMEDTVIVFKGDADSIFVAVSNDRSQYGTFLKYTTNDTIVIANDSTFVHAYAMKGGRYSDTADRIYSIEEEGGNEEPIVLTFTPASGAEVKEGDTVKIECSNEETVVYFMMFDTKANAEAFDEGKWEEAIVEDVVLIYPEEDDEFAVYPVITKEKPVIKVGYATPDEEDQDKTIWNFIYAVYTIKQGQTPDPTKPAAPVFTPEAGAVDSNTVVTIAKGTADSIFVAFGKTVAEAVAFAKYTADVTVNIVKDTVIRAYAMKDGKYSDTIDRAYTLKPAATVQDTVETPIFSVEGEVEKGTKVTISCTTTGAKIYYTVNGDVPTAQSTEYTAQIVIDSAMTIKAIAVKEGSVDSKVAEASYTIKKVANEGAELAGVRLYPNPNNGEFNVSVPVRVQVEVFTVNGMLVKDMTIAQGNTQIRLENSGIYFVRFTAENGQAAVKRVIVR